MKSVMLSIKPKYCELIVNGKKTVEIRKTKPKIETPFKCYIYCTKDYPIQLSICNKTGTSWVGNGKVIGEFVCNKITKYPHESYNDGEHLMPFGDLEKTCLDGIQIYDYLGIKDGYGWHISKLKIYDKPKELSEFVKPCIYGEESERPCFTCDKSGYAPDMHIDCFNTVTRPPQSYCYVEELI